MKYTLSWDEVQLLSYDLYKLMNQLKAYEPNLTNEHVKSSMIECQHSLQRLITDIRMQPIVE